jgi:hypothetical protein
MIMRYHLFKTYYKSQNGNRRVFLKGGDGCIFFFTMVTVFLYLLGTVKQQAWEKIGIVHSLFLLVYPQGNESYGYKTSSHDIFFK